MRQTNKPQKIAGEFLKALDGESLFQLALLADAGDEEAILLRAHDQEVIEVSSVPDMVSDFARRIEFLFLKRGALQCGYTKLVHTWLKQKHLVPDPNGLRELCLDEAAVDRCFHRMAAWVSLAISTLQCELPGFEVVNSFKIFKFNTCLGQGVIDMSLKKLANTFKMPVDQLKLQFQNYHSSARRVDVTNDPEKWRQVLLRKICRPCAATPREHLAGVVARACLMTRASASSNERDFSFNVRHYVKHRGLLRSSWRTRERQLHEACLGPLIFALSLSHLY